ncbi:MAG: acylphosphatase [Candidatus Altiarchaeota archaeon]|nr:acylphosphatase [Candidatus Altiarchaeota archaeon]
MRARAHVFVSGKVQGVFFRSTTKDVALKSGVNGWVRNLEDGRVEVLLEGEKVKVKKVVDWLYHGPPESAVSLVDVEWEEYTGQYNTFFITY